MVRQYSSKTFLRNAPNALLARYFKQENLLTDLNIEKRKPRDIEPIFEAVQALPDGQFQQIEGDFQRIHSLSNKSGNQVILEVARDFQLDFVEAWEELKDFYDKAFWTFLEYNRIFNAAMIFYNADNLPNRYWKKRLNVPSVKIEKPKERIVELAKHVAYYFRTTEGRGRASTGDYYCLNEREYFFIYPEDYVQTIQEYEESRLINRTHNPAFEVIFVYNAEQGTLSTFHEGKKQVVGALEVYFSDHVLKTKLPPESEDEKVYDLSTLQHANFNFVYGPETGIGSIWVKKLGLQVDRNGALKRITVEANPSQKGETVYHLMDDLFRKESDPMCDTCHKIPFDKVTISDATLFATFLPDGQPGRNSRTFTISYPNKCNLKQEGRDLVLQEMLLKSGIERNGAGA